jgi:hypothetical protein
MAHSLGEKHPDTIRTKDDLELIPIRHEWQSWLGPASRQWWTGYFISPARIGAGSTFSRNGIGQL